MFDNMHDNKIMKYTVDFENDKIIIYSIDETENKANIIFENIFTYLFKNQQKDSIIIDIEERKVEEFIENNTDLLKQQKSFTWPAFYNNLQELKAIIEKERYNYYILYSFCGMCGWVLSQKIRIEKV